MTRIYLDSADIDEIRHFARWGIIDGITTTPTFFRHLGVTDAMAAAGKICAEFPGEVHLEALGRDADEIVMAARRNRELGDNVVSKVPIGEAGLEAAYRLAEEAVPVNLHLVFTTNQAMLAARARATYVCPLLGRMSDAGLDGPEILAEIIAALSQYPDLSTQVMASSIRDRDLARASILAGADVLTVSPAVLRQMLRSPLTDRALDIMIEDERACSSVSTRMRSLRQTPVVEPTTPLLESLALMTRHALGTAAVVVDDRIVGVITDGDVRRALPECRDDSETLVDEVMTRAPKCVQPDDTVEAALDMINAHRVSELIVVDPSQRPLGILSVHDIMAGEEPA